MNDDHQSQRIELWCNAWVAVASSSNCDRTSVPASWADRALRDFDERFTPPPAAAPTEPTSDVMRRQFAHAYRSPVTESKP